MEEGNFYHIYNRGNNKEKIFFEEKNYRYFLQQFDLYLSSFVDVYAYCLMPNHFHFLIKIKSASGKQTSEVLKTSEVFGRKLVPWEKAFKDFFISYAKAINKMYDRTGSLFQSKFKKKEIIDNAYFTGIIQYIHANPLKAKLCMAYSEYQFSSYNAIINKGKTKVMKQEVLEWFGNREMFIKVHEERRIEIETIEKFIFS